MLHPTTDHGYRICYLCADGHYIERDITPSSADDARREFDRKYYDRGTLSDYEFTQLHDAVQVAVDIQESRQSARGGQVESRGSSTSRGVGSTPIPSRLSALRSAVRRLIDAVGEWLGGEQCCGK